jgi:predicted RNA-binding Zn ribbon-like protein
VVRVTPESIRLQGGSLSLDFANSADWTEDEEIVAIEDALTEPDSLERWGARLGVAGAPGGAAELAAARELRAALHGIFSALAREQEPAADALACLQRSYAEAVAAGALVRADGALTLDWPREERRRVRFAVAADAVALLADPARVARLHRCPGRDCGWVFLNTSGRRRWCSMDTCGARAKMRRMYARRRATGSADPTGEATG